MQYDSSCYGENCGAASVTCWWYGANGPYPYITALTKPFFTGVASESHALLLWHEVRLMHAMEERPLNINVWSMYSRGCFKTSHTRPDAASNVSAALENRDAINAARM